MTEINNTNIVPIKGAEEEIKDCRAVVDTMGVNIRNENLECKDLLLEENKHQLKEWSNAINYNKVNQKEEVVHMVVKMHNIFKDSNGKEHYIKGYKQQKELFEMLMNEISVLNYEDIDIVRRDIAIDFDFDFNENFKKLLYLFDLLTIGTAPNKRWFTTNLDTLEPNSIKLKTSKFEISFYDKKQESNGNAEYGTRLEFRYLCRKGVDIDKSIDDLLQRFSEVNEKSELVNTTMIERLTKKYDKLIKEDPTMSFAEFVKCHKIFFYNREILKGVYEYVGLKGSFNGWLKKYRERRKFELYSDREMISRFGIVEDVKRALKVYIKS